MKRGAEPRPVYVPVITVLILAQIVFVAAYVGHERTIYFWDHAMYIGMAQQFYDVFTQNASIAWAMFRQSLADNYNLIFALPSLASFFFFDPSRLVFILTNFVFFFLAFEVAVAFLLHRSLGLSWGTALILSLVTACLIPPLWLPLLEGYPDIGAAACIVFAAGVGWRGAERGGLVGRALGLGLLLAFAVLLRRHFIYAAIAMLGTFGGIELWEIWRSPNKRLPRVGQAAVYFMLCGIAFATTLAIIAPDFVRSALTTDYGKLYISYHRPESVFLRFAIGSFGIGILLAAASGIVLLARTGEAGKKFAVFAMLYLFLWLAVWCFGPDQTGHHYLLHALPLFAAIGFAGWYWYIAHAPSRKKYFLGCSIALVLAANSAWNLWLSSKGVWPNDTSMPGFFSAPRPPVVREDYDELHRLAVYLQRTTRLQDRIMVVGSSFIFNLDLLNHVFADIPGARDMAARFSKNPEIDHEEPAPFDVFAGSNIYLVPSPAQYHLAPEGQRVITAAAHQFPPPPDRATMFRADDAVFHLADGVELKIWRRNAWTPNALHDVIADIRRDGPQDANFNQDWVSAVLPLRTQLATNPQSITSAAALFDADRPNWQLFLDRALDAGHQRLAFSPAGNCPGARFNLAVLTPEGREGVPKSFTPGPGADEFSSSFTVSGEEKGRFLQLDVATEAAGLCRMELHNLRLEKIP